MEVPQMSQTLERPGSRGIELPTAPITEERPWVVFSACRDRDSDLFFPETKAQERSALRICAICPVQAECLDYAFEADVRFGVWGGMSEKQRRRLARRIA
jgi:WhiB family redox-sensing transcriptional regulator